MSAWFVNALVANALSVRSQYSTIFRTCHLPAWFINAPYVSASLMLCDSQYLPSAGLVSDYYGGIFA
jgi:hypothetical protein